MHNRLLVLEGTWDTTLSEHKSVRPMVEGWGDAIGVDVIFRYYEAGPGLRHWLEQFFLPSTMASVCYIAGHGAKRKLAGLQHDIDHPAILEEVTRAKGKKGSGKGLLLGACEVGASRKRRALLKRTGKALKWVAGYRPVCSLDGRHAVRPALPHVPIRKAH